jgi:hypothetical protein
MKPLPPLRNETKGLNKPHNKATSVGFNGWSLPSIDNLWSGFNYPAGHTSVSLQKTSVGFGGSSLASIDNLKLCFYSHAGQTSVR